MPNFMQGDCYCPRHNFFSIEGLEKYAPPERVYLYYTIMRTKRSAATGGGRMFQLGFDRFNCIMDAR